MEKENLSPKQKESVIINKTDKPNSYEFGKAGNRFKIYFNTALDLNIMIRKLKELGIYKDE